MGNRGGGRIELCEKRQDSIEKNVLFLAFIDGVGSGAAHRNGGAACRAGLEASFDSDPTLRGGAPCLAGGDFASVDSCAEYFLFPEDLDDANCRCHPEPSWQRATAKASRDSQIAKFALPSRSP